MEYFSKGPKLKKSRTGAMPKNVTTILDGQGHDTKKIPGEEKVSMIQFQAFGDELRKIAAGAYSPNAAANMSTGMSGVPPSSVTPDEAIEAAEILDKSKRKPLVGAAKFGLVGGAAAPLTAAAARGVKGFVDSGGGIRSRLSGAGREVANTTAGTIAGQAAGGFLSGATLAKARAELTENAAERRVNQFLKERGA